MIGYHVTTPRKLARYEHTGGILPPVRFWSTPYAAERWARKTGRPIVLRIEVGEAFPLPIKGGAWWSREMVRRWVTQ